MSLFTHRYNEACDATRALIEKGEIWKALVMYDDLRETAKVIRDSVSDNATKTYREMEARIKELSVLLVSKSDPEDLPRVLCTVSVAVSDLGIELLQ